jgi:hypothetical protein
MLQLGEGLSMGVGMPIHLADAAARRDAAAAAAAADARAAVGVATAAVGSAALAGGAAEVPPLPPSPEGQGRPAVEYCVFRHGADGVLRYAA